MHVKGFENPFVNLEKSGKNRKTDDAFLNGRLNAVAELQRSIHRNMVWTTRWRKTRSGIYTHRGTDCTIDGR